MKVQQLEISVWAKGFITVLGLIFDNRGRAYVLENTTGNMFPTQGTGKIIRFDPNASAGKHKVIIAEGLGVPTGITWGY